LPAASAPPVSPNVELLRSVDELVQADRQPDQVTIDFAVQSLGSILDADPGNVEAQRIMRELTRRLESDASQSSLGVAASSEDVAEEDQRGIRKPASLAIDEAQALVREAAELFEAGQIVSPAGRNAVALLRTALTLDPTNDAALQLVQRSADRLVADAKSADWDGRAFDARNLIEEVLAFYPEHSEAKAMWAGLTSESSEGL